MINYFKVERRKWKEKNKNLRVKTSILKLVGFSTNAATIFPFHNKICNWIWIVSDTNFSWNSYWIRFN